jgi:AcrR family transcriptional regulator
MRTGSASRPGTRAADSRQALIEAAVDVLRHQGFAAATARTIAARVGCNQGLVFYHFGSVVGLLLAALDEVSAQRRQRYERALAGVHGAGELVELAARVFAEDLDTGDAKLLVEMIAGTASTPGLASEVKARMTPWAAFAQAALAPVLDSSPLGARVAPEEATHAVVALYLGLELLSHLDGDPAPALALFDQARRMVPLLALMAGSRPAGTDRSQPAAEATS